MPSEGTTIPEDLLIPLSISTDIVLGRFFVATALDHMSEGKDAGAPDNSHSNIYLIAEGKETEEGR